MRVRCPENLQLAFASIPPYIYKTEDSKITGVFGNIISDAVRFWCNERTNISYVELESGIAGLEDYIMNGTADVIFPIPSVSNKRFFIGRPFIPVGKQNLNDKKCKNVVIRRKQNEILPILIYKKLYEISQPDKAIYTGAMF